MTWSQGCVLLGYLPPPFFSTHLTERQKLSLFVNIWLVGAFQQGKERERERNRAQERENTARGKWLSLFMSVLSLPHKSWTTCSLEVITPRSEDILHVNSESLHLKLGVKIPFPPIDKLNHLQGDGIWSFQGLEPVPVLVSECYCEENGTFFFVYATFHTENHHP